MQDTNQIQNHHQQHQNFQIKNNFFKQILQPMSNRTPFVGYEPLFLHLQAKKMLETVLSNVKINAVPTSREEYTNLTKQIIENSAKANLNVAHIVRSLADIVKYDAKLHDIVIKQFGFQQETRFFHNALFKNSNESSHEIGIVYFKDFLISFGLTFSLFQSGEEAFMRSHLQNYQIQENQDDNIQFLKMNDSQQLGSLISPPSSQQIQEAKKREAESILQVFEKTQTQFLTKEVENYDDDQNRWNQKESNENDNSEELLAHENINLENNCFSQSNAIQYQQKNENPQKYSGFQAMFQNLNKNQANDKKSQQKQSHQQFQDKSNNISRGSNEINTSSAFKIYDQSLLSANNSCLATPIQPSKQPNHSLYPYNSEFKSRTTQKQLFCNQLSSFDNPFHQSSILKDNFPNAKSLFASASKATPTLQKPMSGQKRQSFGALEIQGKLSKDGYSTPLSKRQKLDTYSAHDQEEERSEGDSDSDEDKELNDNISSASRKKRGLKILSVKVQELVYKNKQTTYKDVANELIKQLRENKKKIQELGEIDADDSMDGEDDEMSEDSPNKKIDGKESTSQQKWEKNVRRRVYDALNVLYAAGVLKKEGKHVSCDNKVVFLNSKMKDQGLNLSMKSSASKNSVAPQDQRMLQHIEQLKHQLSKQKQQVDQKREILSDQFKHYVSYMHLIDRNRDNKAKGYFDENKSIALPFILVSTKDCPSNEVEISFGEQDRSLNIAMKEPMKCIGDADTLIKLGLYKVDQEWIDRCIPESNNILKSLTEKQRKEILI